MARRGESRGGDAHLIIGVEDDGDRAVYAPLEALERLFCGLTAMVVCHANSQLLRASMILVWPTRSVSQQRSQRVPGRSISLRGASHWWMSPFSRRWSGR